EHQAELDELIVRYADRWAIDRMPVIDRSLVRMALFELLHSDDVPVAVVINEAVELAKELSTDDSGRFVNGLLGRIAERETTR
ncbi:MAG TPA: transcription antitermination factor NusB, partial [Actinomycetota bacterium]|nr:transcription antitermination factor NusB [Actinomycetota bacterium]